MSDIDKAEELLKKLVRATGTIPMPDDVLDIRYEALEYLNKPVVIKDWNDEAVRIYVDSDKDVSFEWDDDTPDIIAFDPDELVRGLREIGVIQ